ncbi:MAG: tRNA (adenosine(37)-N6)-threonylcarbamoyltransferase complex ATPase subunit type 1 TsaE [Bdellovibrionota bacterium]
MEKSNELLNIQADENAIVDIAGAIAKIIVQSKPFVLYLNGEMGAGKTTLTRYILKSLGLPNIIPVTSPTFSYINEYEISHATYAHMDLYRADGNFDITDLGLSEEREFAGFFVEWPEKLNSNSFLQPTHILHIDYANNHNSRQYTLFQS